MQADPAPAFQDAAIWVDVEDVLVHFAANPRPSGIQRLAFELVRELRRLAPGRIHLVRRGSTEAPLQDVEWDTLRTAFAAPATPPGAARPDPRLATRRRLKHAIHQLPPPLREPLLRAAVLQSQALRGLRQALHAPRPAPLPQAATPDSDATPRICPGDHLLVLGAPWAIPGFPAWATALKQRHGMAITLLLYDLIPAREPEWTTPAATARFQAWLDATLPLADRLLAISRHTAADTEAYAREHAIPLAGPVHPIPIGTGFDVPAHAPRQPGLPQPGTYALFVSTLEARKNHALAVRVWRRLADEVQRGARPPESVPQLVFAGRIGFLTGDLLQQLDNTGWLGGRVRFLQDPTDAELHTLYQGCLFTLFPSLSEGWGLPVTESLAYGKPCLASSATAIPEAGGTLCRYIDPEDTPAAHRAVTALLDDRDGLAAWEARVRREFHPTPWAHAALAVLAHLDQPA